MRREATDRQCPECGNAMTKLPKYNGQAERIWKCQYCGRPVRAMFHAAGDGRWRLAGIEPMAAACR